MTQSYSAQWLISAAFHPTGDDLGVSAGAQIRRRSSSRKAGRRHEDRDDMQAQGTSAARRPPCQSTSNGCRVAARRLPRTGPRGCRRNCFSDLLAQFQHPRTGMSRNWPAQRQAQCFAPRPRRGVGAASRQETESGSVGIPGHQMPPHKRYRIFRPERRRTGSPEARLRVEPVRPSSWLPLFCCRLNRLLPGQSVILPEGHMFNHRPGNSLACGTGAGR